MIPHRCCSLCFEDPVLRRYIKRHGQPGFCDVCEKDRKRVIWPHSLSDLFEPLLSMYRPDHSDGNTYHCSLAECIDDEDGWGVFSEKIPREARDGLLDAIRVASPSPKDLQCINRSGDPWESVSPGVDNEWTRFADHIKWNRRFSMEGSDGDFPVSNPALWLPQVLPQVSAALSKGTELFRCRTGCTEDHHGMHPYPAEQMGAPPCKLAKRGRANPAGIPYLYAAKELATSVAEMRPHTGETLSGCRLKLQRAANVVDLTNIHGVSSPFDVNDLQEAVRRNRLLNHLNYELSRPVLPDTSEIEYVPTQFLAEMIRNQGFDGILYKSSMHAGGTNIVLFEPWMAPVQQKTWIVQVTSVSVDYGPKIMPSEE